MHCTTFLPAFPTRALCAPRRAVRQCNTGAGLVFSPAPDGAERNRRNRSTGPLCARVVSLRIQRRLDGPLSPGKCLGRGCPRPIYVAHLASRALAKRGQGINQRSAYFLFFPAWMGRTSAQTRPQHTRRSGFIRHDRGHERTASGLGLRLCLPCALSRDGLAGSRLWTGSSPAVGHAPTPGCLFSRVCARRQPRDNRRNAPLPRSRLQRQKPTDAYNQ